MTAPMPRIQLTYTLICDFLNTLGVKIDTAPNALNLLALEGASPRPELDGLIELNPNDPDFYNDSLVMFWKDKFGQHVQILKVTTEPGKLFTQIRPNPHGAANLVWGHHLYKKGKHRGRDALVSASGRDRVWRDKDKDFTQDVGEKVETGYFGIHIHDGGTEEKIGPWSAGCIVIYGGYLGDQYRTFLHRVETHPGHIFNLTLWGAEDVWRWTKDKTNWRPTLWFGVQNSWVARMQRMLKQWVGVPVVIDGDWGLKTQEAMDLFCNFKQLSKTITTSQELWKALEGH